MSKNIIVCCDGTGNEISENISNVLKLYRTLRKKPTVPRTPLTSPFNSTVRVVTIHPVWPAY
jgi:Uncharacterized alpha/beta hydrolase domain (DUF2235)